MGSVLIQIKSCRLARVEGCNEIHMEAGRALDRGTNTELEWLTFFSNTDQLGPALFYSQSCLTSLSRNKASTQEQIPLLTKAHMRAHRV